MTDQDKRPAAKAAPVRVTREKDISKMFTSIDISCMANQGLDLTDYTDVSANAQHIYDRVRDGGETPRMPAGQTKWSQEWVDRFKSWIDQGTPEKD